MDSKICNLASAADEKIARTVSHLVVRARLNATSIREAICFKAHISMYTFTVFSTAALFF